MKEKKKYKKKRKQLKYIADNETNTSGRFNFSEFVVDFLGALVPGLIFLFLLSVVVSGPIGFLIIQIKNVMFTLGVITENIDSISMLKELMVFSNDFWIELGIFILIASYVIGHCFFRKDPKVPDNASYKRISKKFTSKKQRDSWVVQPDENNHVNIEYPYLYLKEYLIFRNLPHLAKLVPWSGKDKNTHNMRTKFFINMLKIRLQFYFSNRCGNIRRNEGHVRLMSSVWFISNSLISIGIIGLIILSSTILSAALLKSPTIVYSIVPFVICLFVILFSIWSRNTIEKYIHYMRVREILYVLETAYTANKLNPLILKDLKK